MPLTGLVVNHARLTGGFYQTCCKPSGMNSERNCIYFHFDSNLLTWESNFRMFFCQKCMFVFHTIQQPVTMSTFDHG
jgi:hypothetical protein